MRSFLVFKVKFRDSLRRFTEHVLEDGQLELNMEALRIKILQLYSLAPDTDLKLTYIDQDGDEVTMVDDNDLHDVMMQKLNPLRIDVILNEDINGRSDTRDGGSSRPVRSPSVQDHLPIRRIDVAETLKPMLDMMNEQFSEASSGPVTKAMLSDPLSDVLDDFFSMIRKSINIQACQPEDKQVPNASHQLPVTGRDIAETLKSKLDTLKGQLSKVSSDPEIKAMTSVPLSEVRVDLFSKFVQNINKAYQLEDKHDPHTSQQLAATNTAVEEILISLIEQLNKELLKTLEAIKGIISDSVLDALVDFFSKIGKSSKSQVAKSRGKNVSNIQNAGSESSPDGSNTVDPMTEAVDQSMKDFTQRIQNIRQTRSTPGSFEEQVCPVTASVDLNTLPPAFPHPLAPLSVHEGVHDFSISSIGKSLNDEKAMEIDDTRLNGKPLFTGSYARANSAIQSTEGLASVTSPSQGITPVHVNFKCDDCGSYPINGPQFRSKVKQNYDLCSICPSNMGKEDDYDQIDHPIQNPSVSQHQPNEPVMPAPQCPTSSNFQFVSKPLFPRLSIFSTEMDSHFVRDVNFKDGTLVAPSAPFNKIWRMQNNGKLTWPRGTQLVWTGGDRFSSEVSTEIKIAEEGLPTGKELDMAINFIAPKHAGPYISYWRMASPTGERFGQQVWVKIQVVDVAPKDSLCDQNYDGKMGISDFHFGAPEENSFGQTSSAQMRRQDKGKTIAVEQYSKTNYYRRLPRSPGNLFRRRRGTAPFSESSFSSKPAAFPQSSSISGDRDDSFFNQSDIEVEKIFLKDSETWGLKDVELNRRALKKNDYNLDDSLDELIGKTATDAWDDSLEKLMDMGFDNRELNKELLMKYNGDIMAVITEHTGGV